MIGEIVFAIVLFMTLPAYFIVKHVIEIRKIGKPVKAVKKARTFFRLSWLSLFLSIVLGTGATALRLGSQLNPTATNNLFWVASLLFLFAIISISIFIYLGHSSFKNNINLHIQRALEILLAKDDLNKIHWQKTKTAANKEVWVAERNVSDRDILGRKKSVSEMQLEIKMNGKKETSEVLFPSACIWCGEPSPFRFNLNETSYKTDQTFTQIRSSSIEYSMPIYICDQHYNKYTKSKAWYFYASRFWTPFDAGGISMYFFLLLFFAGAVSQIPSFPWEFYLISAIFIFFPLSCLFIKRKIDSYGPHESLDFGICFLPFFNRYIFSNEKLATAFIDINKNITWKTKKTTWSEG